VLAKEEQRDELDHQQEQDRVSNANARLANIRMRINGFSTRSSKATNAISSTIPPAMQPQVAGPSQPQTLDCWKAEDRQPHAPIRAPRRGSRRAGWRSLTSFVRAIRNSAITRRDVDPEDRPPVDRVR